MVGEWRQCDSDYPSAAFREDFKYEYDVVDAMEETGKVVVDGVVYCLICVAKLALIITAPVWALPYTIWRKGRKL